MAEIRIVGRLLLTAGVTCLFMGLATPSPAVCHIGSFVGAPYRVTEADGRVVITYTNNAGPNAQPSSSVHYETIDASARAGADYDAVSGTLTWGSLPAAAPAAINPAHRSFTVPVRQDTRDEPDETFTIQMSDFTGCFDANASEKSAVVTVVDDDAAPAARQTTAESPSTKATPSTQSTSGQTPKTSRAAAPAARTTPTPTARASFSNVASPIDGETGLPRSVLYGVGAGVLAIVAGGWAWLRRRSSSIGR